MRLARNLAAVAGLTLPVACAALYGVSDLPSDVEEAGASSDARAGADAGFDAKHSHDAGQDASHRDDASHHDAAKHDARSPADGADAELRHDATDAQEAAVSQDAPAALAVASVSPSPVQVLQGATAMVTVTLTSAATSAVAITATSLPSGVTVTPGTIAQGSTSGVLTLSASANAADGVTTPTVEAGGATLSFTLVVAGLSAAYDTSFNQSGVLNLVPGGGDDTATAQKVAVTADDSILIAGTTTDAPTGAWALVKVNPDGTPDTSFNANVLDGTKGALLPGSGHVAGVAVVPSTGLIVVAGYDTDGGINELVVFVYNPDGTRHESFGTAGFYERGPEVAFHVTSVTGLAVDPAGDIAVVGNTTGGYVLTLKGVNNATFGLGGAFPAGVALEAVVYEPNGDLVIGGSDPSGGGQLYLGRATSSLSGESFADGGLIGPVGSGNRFLTAAAIANDPSGDVFLVGQDDYADPFGVYAYVTNTGVETTDPGYAHPGPAPMNGSGYLGVACGATDGVAVVVGNGYDMAGNIAFVARVTSAGTLDHTFANAGMDLVNALSAPLYDAVAIDSVGRIVVVGSGVGFYVMRIWP